MRTFEGKYFITNNNDLIFHIKDIHEQANSATCLVEVDDWAGDFNLPFNQWYLKNNNMMFETSHIYLTSLTEVIDAMFITHLIDNMNKSIKEIQSGNSYCRTGWKKTDKRLEILRKRYGTKP
jgi:hypothetical protein